MILTSKNNALIKETASLKEKKGRKQHGLFLVEGRKMATECLRSGLEIERIFLAESYAKEMPFDETLTVRVSDDVFRHLSDEKTPQGILCRVKIPVYSLQKPTGRALLLDGVSDPGNMGAIIRTANAAGYNEIYLTDDCTDPYSPKSVRASMSGLFFTKIYFGTRENIFSALGDTPIFVGDMDGENVFQLDVQGNFALAIGNEGNGISEAVFQRATKRVKIPMQSEQESLNAAVSAGILMYALCKNQFN